MKWLETPEIVPRPKRIADVVVIAPGGKVYDGLVDLAEGRVLKWEHIDGVQPLVCFRSILMKQELTINSDHHGRSPNR